MSQIDSVWYKAVALSERLASLHAAQTDLNQTQRAQSKRLLKRWRSQPPFSEGESFFTQRLQEAGMNEEEFLTLLGEPTEALVTRYSSTPTWMCELQEAFSQTGDAWTHHFETNGAQGWAASAFLSITAPLISYYRGRLHMGLQDLVQTYSYAPFDPQEIEDICVRNMMLHIRTVIHRTMTLELHVARMNDLLHGDTPEERFLSFIEYISQKDVALNLLKEYPVLARLLSTSLQRWVTVSLELLQRLCKDWSQLVQTFCPQEEPGRLVMIESDAGDRHRGGRSVTLLTFSSGWRLVYKPRSLTVERHFQQLLAWLNVQGQQPPFRIMQLITCDRYGWCEYIQPQTCSSEEEISRFYQRQGSYLALLHVLAATDYHYENIIAMGEHPILVDLEALFQPYYDTGREQTKGTDLLAEQALTQSVLRVGILPHRSWEHAHIAGIDVSGLGTLPNQLSPRGGQYWENEGTDEMRIARKRMPLTGGNNRPTLNGQSIQVLDYSEAVVNGFTSTYRLLIRLRDELLSEQGMLTQFAEDEIRVILRPTAIYSLLLRESYHPDVLRDALDRDRFFDKLWVPVAAFPSLRKVITAEQHDLWQGDIPIFFTCPQDRTIWTSTGERISDFLKQSALETVRHRLVQLDEDDLRWQQWLIRASFTALSMSQEQTYTRSYKPVAPASVASTEHFLMAACAIGDHLESQTLREGKMAAWIGVHAFQEHYWKIAPLGLDLYGGLPGVTLFMAYLGHITREKRYTALARAALTNIRHQIEHKSDVMHLIGGFSGWGGLVYLLTHLGVLWKEPALLLEAEQVAHTIANIIAQDEALDVMQGAAGGIVGLIGLYKHNPSKDLLLIMKQCGEHLLAKAQSMPHGIGWITPLATQPLTGFSHGAAGIAWALLQLSAISDEPRFHNAACAAIAYEHSHFLVESNNWRDLRDDTSGEMIAWCHGASGIGLGRLASLPYLDTREIRQDIEIAIEVTLAQGFGHNHSLCHGDFGNLDLLLQAGQLLQKPVLQQQAREKATIILESIERHGWLSGVPLSVETPGLMVGVAGIGYGLLRCAAPDQIPSVLVLEPPIENWERK